MTKPVDPAKGNSLLKKLLGSVLPIVNEPEPRAMPVDQESSLFVMTPEQHQKMVEQSRAEFLSAKKLTPKEKHVRDDPDRPESEEEGFRAGQLRQLQIIHNYRVNRLRDIDSNLPQEEKDRLTARINDETEQRRAMVLSRTLKK